MTRPEKPDKVARCPCGVETEWVWYDAEHPPDSQWANRLCGPCHKVHLAKAKATVERLGPLEDGRLNEQQTARFVELAKKCMTMEYTTWYLTRPFPRWHLWMWPWWWVHRYRRDRAMRRKR